MGIRNRFKEMVKAQVRERLGSFNVSQPEPAAAPPRAPASPVPARPVVAGPPPGLAGFGGRRVISAPRLAPSAPSAPEASAEGPIRLLARAERSGDECSFLADRALLPGGAWFFGDRDAAAGSPLAEAVFGADARVQSILVDDTVVCVTAAVPDWRAASVPIGAAIRDWHRRERPALSEAILAAIPDQKTVLDTLSRVVEEVINPGVAAHSGRVTLTRVRGNSVWIEFGGGCQGCSSAAMTLKHGIWREFRAALPGVGGIYDATDHASGQNPYFS